MQVAEQELHEPQGAYTHFSSKKAPGHKDIVKIVRQAAYMSVYLRSIITFYIFSFTWAEGKTFTWCSFNHCICNCVISNILSSYHLIIIFPVICYLLSVTWFRIGLLDFLLLNNLLNWLAFTGCIAEEAISNWVRVIAISKWWSILMLRSWSYKSYINPQTIQSMPKNGW